MVPILSETCVPRREQIPAPAIAAHQNSSKALDFNSEEPLSQLHWAPALCQALGWLPRVPGQRKPSPALIELRHQGKTDVCV